MDRTFWLVGVFVLLGLGIWFYVTINGTGTGAGGTVTYSVDGTDRASSVSYMTSDGISQSTDVTLPWTHTEYGVGAASLVAQLAGDGSISCDISGDISANNYSSGAYSVVTCAGQ